MTKETRIIQNSMWIGIQPLILNIVSIFATAYIVRNLTQEDYGRFIFAFSMVALLTPLCSLGVRSVLVREMARDIDQAPSLMGRAFSLRLLMALVAYGVAVVLVHVLDIPPLARMLTYLACTTLLFNTVSNGFIDGFQGYQQMKYIAYGNLTSGGLLRVASVLAVMFGFGVIGLTASYVLGPIIAAIMMCVLHRHRLPRFRLEIDGATWGYFLRKGVPFFAVSLVWMLTVRIGIIMLSKTRGHHDVAVYGAANGLIECLSLFPDSISTAMFPAVAGLFAQNAIAEINLAMRRAFEYMVILGLGMAVGLSMLSDQIMGLIYGTEYIEGCAVLSVIAWHLPFWFVMVLLVYCLGAVHMQGRVLASIGVATIAGLTCNAMLIPKYGPLGLAVAYLVFHTLYCGLGVLLVRRHLGFCVHWPTLLRILGASGVLALAVYVFRPYNLLLAVIVPGAVYVAALLVMRAVSREDLRQLSRAVFKR